MKKYFQSLMAGLMALCLTGIMLSCSNAADGASDGSSGKKQTQSQTYHISVVCNGHGTASASPEDAAAGTEVTINLVPENGYEMSSLSVTDADSNAITVENLKFIMPASDVTVTVQFILCGAKTATLSNLEDIISHLEDDATIVMTGEVKSSDLETIKNLINNSEHEIKLDLSSVTGLTKISDSAFGVCSKLSAISIPDTVREIEQFAFISCSGLKTIEIPEGVVTIGHDAFQMSGITFVKIPSSVKSIGKQAFMGCDNLKSIELSYKVTVEPDAFGFCGLESVKISGNDITIEDGAFEYCSNLKSIEISGSGTYIGKFGFSNGRKMESVDITGKNTVIGDYAFGGCSFESITISGSGTTIGNTVFSACQELKSVEFSAGVIAIGKSPVSLCFSLESIKFADVNGWYYTDNEEDWKNKTNGTAMPDLSDAEKNAKYFVNGFDSGPYAGYYLYKLSSNN